MSEIPYAYLLCKVGFIEADEYDYWDIKYVTKDLEYNIYLHGWKSWFGRYESGKDSWL